MIEHSNLNRLQLSSKWIPTTDPWDFYHMHPFMQFKKQSHKIHLRRHQCSPLRPLRGHFVLRKQRRTVGGARKLRVHNQRGAEIWGWFFGAKGDLTVVEYEIMRWTPNSSLDERNKLEVGSIFQRWRFCGLLRFGFVVFRGIYRFEFLLDVFLGCLFKRVTFPMGWDFTMNKLTVFPGEYCLKHVPIPTICSAISKTFWVDCIQVLDIKDLPCFNSYSVIFMISILGPAKTVFHCG